MGLTVASFVIAFLVALTELTSAQALNPDQMAEIVEAGKCPRDLIKYKTLKYDRCFELDTNLEKNRCIDRVTGSNNKIDRYNSFIENKCLKRGASDHRRHDMPSGTRPLNTSKPLNARENPQIIRQRFCVEKRLELDKRCEKLDGDAQETCLAETLSSHRACNTTGKFATPPSLTYRPVPRQAERPRPERVRARASTPTCGDCSGETPMEAPSASRASRPAPRYDCRNDPNMPGWCHPGDPRFPYGR